ncbi:putative ectoine/hydroxyectoine ABC transporter solute-binding protein EhuB [Advenella mimigardefordensis DPN7]|uniref:Putative ectoine/hydroxyectoine ABC transporter solute-binding protein EhuB n=2 Tax=Advenella mimigardefordensis TaxID=302406 RepID=W0P9D7_ADVMD|nr:putative ectoine/hydroxyectoine ABC transporter solute-binding protein EhuB [Advenella mimigardefordensis DPN7]
MNRMRKTQTLLALAVATAAAFGTVASAATLQEIKDKGVVRIAVANEIPYGFVDPTGEAKGAGPEVAKHIMEQLGIKEIKWVTTGFSSLIPGLKADQFDMVAAEMAILPQRCQQVAFSEPNSSYGEGLLVAKGNPDNLHKYEDFSKSDKKIAIMAGADQLEMLQKLGVDDGRMVTISNNADAISTVSTGRAAAYAATSLTVSELAGKSDKVEAAGKFEDPVIDGKPARSWGGFTFDQGSDDLRKAVNEELAKFKKTPEWKQILTNYGFTEHDLEESDKQTTEQLCAAK